MRNAPVHALILCAALALPVAGGAAPVPGGPVAGRLPANVGPELKRLAEERPDERVAAWVFFTDRAGAERRPSALAEATAQLSPRARERRARRAGVDGALISDLPVHDPYVRAIVARGARLRGVSRWLNAASIELPAALAADLARLPFVQRVERVPFAHRDPPVGVPEAVAGGEPLDARARTESANAVPGDPAYYGGTFRQLDMMQVPQLHALGLSGAGVLVCMLDSGFRVTHQAYAGLNVVATRDFINGDLVVSNEVGQDSPGQSDHGTWTLSCVAGSWPGMYSGPAFGASVALGKTEYVPSESTVEMDYWQFGAEWADSLGADVISSSLGYTEFDNPGDSYEYADMDGRTTVVTLAAAEAARRGITVVVSAGNLGASPWFYVVAPGDADTVITVGAVDSNNVLQSFSSRGPTSDGRIKPDVTAMGRSTLCVSPSNDLAFVRVSGTSFSAPLTAGVVALLLESHPAWGPFEVREALRETAANAGTPNNNLGWGLVRALDANAWIPSTTGAPRPAAARTLQLSAGPNPVHSAAGTTIHFAAPADARVTLEVLDLSGRRRARLFEGIAPTPQALRWNGVSDQGAPLPAGVYWIRLTSRAAGGETHRSFRVALLR